MTKARGALLVAVVLAAHAFAYLYWTEDDAGVSLRYAAHLARGEGLVYNPGERVEAISNLGYVLLLAPVYAVLPGPDPREALLLAAKLLGLAAALAGLHETARLGRAAGLSPVTTLAAQALVAASTPYAAWAIGALEVPFVAWASAALVAAAAEIAAGDRRPAPLRRAQAAAAALVLLRVDGFVLPFGIAALLLVLDFRPAAVLRLLAPAAAVLVLVFGFRLGYYGEWWPNPVHAKVELAVSLAAAGDTLAGYVWRFFLLHGTAPLALLATATALSRPVPAPVRRARLVAAGAAGALTGYTLLVGPDWMPLYRFLVAAVIPLAVLLAAGLAGIGERLRLRPSPATVAVLVAGLAAAEALAGHASFRSRRSSPFWYFAPTLSPRALVGFWTPAVDWLGAHVRGDSLLLTSEAGFIPYLSGLRTVDSFGLASRDIARLPRGAVERSTLGVHTRFTEAPAAGPAERLVAALEPSALVLQWRMVAGWNHGRVPATLFGGRFRRVNDRPLGGTWAVYEPLRPDSAGAGSAAR